MTEEIIVQYGSTIWEYFNCSIGTPLGILFGLAVAYWGSTKLGENE